MPSWSGRLQGWLWLVLFCALVLPLGTLQAQSVANFPLRVRDALGRQVTVKALPKRVISLAPSNTEKLFAVGAGQSVIAVTSYDTYPPEVTKLPKVGGFASKSLSVETIVGLQPDVVLAAGAIQRPTTEALERVGITVIAIEDPRHMDDVYADMLLVGKLMGKESVAEDIVTTMRQRIAHVQQRVAVIPHAQRLRVFYEVFNEPLMTAGALTFISQMVDLAGGINIFAEIQERYPQVSAEEVIKRNPACILGLNSHRMALAPESMTQRPGWQQLTAVKNNCVALLEDDMIARPGPRLVEAIEIIAKTLYPQLFP